MSLNFHGQKILIAGGGVTGSSIATFLSSRGAVVVIADKDPNLLSTFPILRPETVVVEEFSAVVVSPGWNESHPLLRDAMRAGIEILNEIDIAWNLAQEIAPHQKWLALTGTNGKTTTVEMAAAMLQRAGLKAIACGNVGDTVIDAVNKKEGFDYLVLELSSFQLHWLRQARFVSVAILNIADDHLDWHGSFEEYSQAKLSLLDRAETAILNGEDNAILQGVSKWDGRKIFFSLNTPAPGELGVVDDRRNKRYSTHASAQRFKCFSCGRPCQKCWCFICRYSMCAHRFSSRPPSH
jgi:UDP-N-acetylmuramoylalanine--D-glutamate ligase